MTLPPQYIRGLSKQDKRKQLKSIKKAKKYYFSLLLSAQIS